MKRKIGNTTIDILPPVKRYMNAIERRLRVDRPTRLRIMTELAGDFESRRESGQSDEQIMAELGTPAQVAAQFNAAFGAPRLDRRWRWAFVAAAVLVAALAVLPGLLAPGGAASVGVIGGVDGPTSIYVTASPMQNLVSIFPWLLGCAGGFLLPVWRRPRSGQGGGASLLLCGLGLLPLCIVIMELGVVAYTGQLPAAQLGAACWALLTGFFRNGEWLCAAVLAWAIWDRRRTKKAAEHSVEKN